MDNLTARRLSELPQYARESHEAEGSIDGTYTLFDSICSRFELSKNQSSVFEVTADDLKGIVTSKAFVLFSPSKSQGIELPYQSIILHAIEHGQVQYLYAQLEDTQNTLVSDGSAHADEDDQMGDPVLELKVFVPEGDRLKTLYENLCHASSLNPDPSQSDSDDQAIDFDNHEWITADNVDQFADIADEELDEPTAHAGQPRPRQDDTNGSESKWRRLD